MTTTPPLLTDEQCIEYILAAGFERNSFSWTFTYGRLDYHLLKFARAIESATRAPLLAEIERLQEEAGFAEFCGEVAQMKLSSLVDEAWADRDAAIAELEAHKNLVATIGADNCQLVADVAHLTAELAEARAALEVARVDAERWKGLYRRAINEANGLTNYVEERPELRRAERNLSAIEAEARAAIDTERENSNG